MLYSLVHRTGKSWGEPRTMPCRMLAKGLFKHAHLSHHRLNPVDVWFHCSLGSTCLSSPKRPQDMPPATPLSASSALFRGIRGIFLCTSPKPQPRVTIRQYANRRSNGSRPNQDPRFEEFESGPRHQQYRSNPQYTRFGRAQTSYMLFRRWRARPTFKYEVGGLGGLGGLFYYANLETVPVTARRRFNIVSEAQEEGLADQMYQQVMQEYGERILPAYDVRTQKVERVLKRLLPSAQAMGMTEKDWKVHVIEDPQKNAFVIPGYVLCYWSERAMIVVFKTLITQRQPEAKCLFSLGSCPCSTRMMRWRLFWATKSHTTSHATVQRG